MKFLLIVALCIFNYSFARDLKVGDLAPHFIVQTDTNIPFDLNSRKGSWTIMYFYPKAGTSGCTAQAIAFKNDMDKIEKLGAKVFGISTDSVADQAKFKQEHGLNFTLLADDKNIVTELYGSKYPFLSYSKRWSYIIDPELRIRFIEKDVEASEDAKNLILELTKLKASPLQ